MTEKALLIIETAMKLFAKKGINATSIQEIAKESGISKGAFYLHFKSKEALLIGIFELHSKQIQQKILDIEVQDLPPRETFIKQVQAQIEELEQHKEFIIMQVRERAIPFSVEIKNILRNMRMKQFLFYQQTISSIYGNNVDKHLMDLCLMMQGIFKAYIELIIFEHVSFNSEQIAHFLLRRMDDLVKGILQEIEEPLLREDSLNFIDCLTTSSVTKEGLLMYLEAVEQQLDPDKQDEAYETLQVILDELHKEKPRKMVLKGMLTNFEDEHWNKVKMLISQFIGSLDQL
ncbi:TetR/AcrR family transcriptional regulator [Bacillus sp. 2205SS5-2]|uniref:TetR/AcrR family transcriptional regulator n=1 Tax=Bacillus sp. 2205SS5-2 TaxID=3109031 RepID=UPI0030049B3A